MRVLLARREWIRHTVQYFFPTPARFQLIRTGTFTEVSNREPDVRMRDEIPNVGLKSVANILGRCAFEDAFGNAGSGSRLVRIRQPHFMSASFITILDALPSHLLDLDRQFQFQGDP